jgi:predicted PurR-regulated permease PerM
MLARWRVPRLIGSTLVLGAVLAALAFVALELAAPAAAWAEQLPRALHRLEERARLLAYPLDLASPLLQTAAKAAEGIGADRVLRVATVERGQLQGLVEGAATFTTQLVLTMVLSFLLLVEGDTLVGRLSRTAATPASSQRAAVILNEVSLRMSRYLRTVTLINIGLGTVLTGALHLLGMPNPWLWGGMAALLTYVPYLGPAVGIGLVALASFVAFPTTGAALAPPLVYFALSTIEGNVVTPLLLGRTLRVSPLILFVWLTVWVWLWSVPGAILASPLLMLLKFAFDESPRAAGIAYVMGK